LILDRSRSSARFNSSTFCAVCGNGWHEKRNNWDVFAKVGYFLSTQNSGSHNLVAIGQPISPDSYQTPRTFSCSLGIRF